MKIVWNKVYTFVAAAGAYLLGQYLRGVWFLGSSIPNLCGHTYGTQGSFCNSPYLDSGWALILIGKYLFVTALILLFAKGNHLWHWWWKFSAMYVSVSVAIIFGLFPQQFLAGTVLEQTNAAGFLFAIYLIVAIVAVTVDRIKTPHRSPVV